MTRRLKDGIINALCEYTKDTEIPTIFSLWTAMSAISSALGRDCFIDRGYFVVFPNLYIVLVAGSAACKKSSAIMLTHKLIEKIQPRVHILSQKMTPEALIGSLSGMTAKDSTLILDEACGILIVDELSTLIDRNAFKSGMISLLTKLFDCQDFPYETRGRGVELIKNPCLSILGGSTLHWIKESVPQESIGGGFTSRILFVYKDKNEKIQPWPSVTMENKKRIADIAHDLNEVAKMRGGFGITDEALNLFKAEYETFRRKSPLIDNPNLSGYAGRRDTILLKLCMVVSASVDDRRVVDVADMNQAIRALKLIERDMPRVLQAISMEVVGDVCEQVLTLIMNSSVGGIARPQLVKAMRHRLTVRQLDIILETLMEERVVESVKDRAQVSYVFKKGR
jgi:hypothetical protein